MKQRELNYTKCVVIVHGKSELCLARYIYTNLHLPVKMIAADNGRASIQITGLRTFLEKKIPSSLKKFADEYTVEYDKKTKKLVNFKLFIIMDTDDCDEKMREEYISKKMFSDLALGEYIVPLFNITNLEDVLVKAGIMHRKIANSKKGTYYADIFPINTEPMSYDTINQVRAFAEIIKPIKETNLEKYIEFCYKEATGEDLFPRG